MEENVGKCCQNNEYKMVVNGTKINLEETKYNMKRMLQFRQEEQNSTNSNHTGKH